MPSSRLIFVAAFSVWSLICLAEDLDGAVSRWGYLPDGVSLAVEVDARRPWWSHWLLGELDAHQLSQRADELAAEFSLLNSGSQPGFRNVFVFSLPNVTSGVASMAPRRQGLEESVSGHPSVRWAAIQHPLKRTKRGFNDPRFKAQWHLVIMLSSLLSISLFI